MANIGQVLQRNKGFRGHLRPRGSQHHRQAPRLRNHAPGSPDRPSAFELGLGDAATSDFCALENKWW